MRYMFYLQLFFINNKNQNYIYFKVKHTSTYQFLYIAQKIIVV